MTDHENTTGILDEEALRAALGPERVVPRGFREGVGERIAELEAQRGARRARLHAAPERLRWVASILPPGIIPGAATVGGLAGKKLTLKAAPGLLALPAISVAMVFAAVVGAFFALSRQRMGVGAGEQTASEVQRGWWRRNRHAAGGALALLAALVWFQHPETVVVLVLASLAATTILLGDLARAGLVDRRSVGLALAKLLWAVGFNWYLFRNFLPRDPSGLDAGVGPAMLVVGALPCFLFARPVRWARVRTWLANPVPMRHPDALTTWCLRLIVWPVVLYAAVIVVSFSIRALLQLVPHTPSRAGLVASVEHFDASSEVPEEWLAFERVALHLTRDGGEAPDLGSVRERLAPHLETQRDRPWAKFPVLRLDLIDHAQVERLVGASPKILDQGGPLLHLGSADVADIYGLAALGRLSREVRDGLAERIAGTHPNLDRIGSLSQVLRKAELLEFLGHPELAELQRDDVHDLLVRCWRGTYSSSLVVAGFAGSPGIAKIDVSRFAVVTMHWGDVRWNQAAVELMARYGVPEAIDLRRVRRAVAASARPEPLTRLLGFTAARRLAEVALLQLDALAPEARPSLWATIVDRRAVLGALLLSIFSVVATLRAPRPGASA